jgi:bacteriorhodopsin
LLHAPRGAPVAVDRRSAPYRVFLVVLALVPMVGLFFSFREVQKFYTVIGAYVFPLLAATLLVFNSRERWVGARLKNRPLTAIALAAVLAFFTWLAVANIEST